MSTENNIELGKNLTYHNSVPNRKERLKAHLDDFISREKEILSGQGGQGEPIELQYRLDNFMHRLHERMDLFLQEKTDTEAVSDLIHSESEVVHDEALMEELLPASELLYLEETIGEERAAAIVQSLEDEFKVYEIRGLNVKEESGLNSKGYIIKQVLIGVVAALLLLWFLWPSTENQQRSERNGIETKVEPYSEAEREVAVKAVVKETVIVDEPVIDKAIIDRPAEVNFEKLTVVSSFGNIRSRASAKGDVLFQVKQGDVVIKLDSRWGWHQIRMLDGREGWAYEGLFIEASIAGDESGNDSAVEAGATAQQ